MEAEVDVLCAFSRLARGGERMCAVCLRGAREARLVQPRALRSFLSAVDSPALRTHMMFVEWVCYMCEAQAATAMRFHRAVESAAAVHRLFNVIKKKVCVDPEMELEARRLDAQLSAQRAHSRLRQTEVLLVDSTAGTGEPSVGAAPPAPGIASALQPGVMETVILDDDDDERTLSDDERTLSPPPEPAPPPAAPGALPALVPIETIIEDGVVERCGSVAALIPNEMQMMLRSLSAPDTFVLHPVVRAPPPSGALLVPSLNVRLVDNRLQPLDTTPAPPTNTNHTRGAPETANSAHPIIDIINKNGGRVVTRVTKRANSLNKSDNSVNKSDYSVNNKVTRGASSLNKSDNSVNKSDYSVNNKVTRVANSVNKSDYSVNNKVTRVANSVNKSDNSVNNKVSPGSKCVNSDDNAGFHVYSVNNNLNRPNMHSAFTSFINNNNSDGDTTCTKNSVDDNTDGMLERILQEKVSARAKRTTLAPRPPPGVGEGSKRARQEAAEGGSYMVDFEMVSRLLREGDEARREKAAREGGDGAGDVIKAPVVKAGRIDWEDKIPADIISFMDATDPQATQLMAPPRSPAPPPRSHAPPRYTHARPPADTEQQVIIDLC